MPGLVPHSSSARWFYGADGRVRPFWRAVMFLIAAGLLLVVSGMTLAALLELIWPGSRAALRAGGVPPLQLAFPLYAASNAALLLCSWLFLISLDHRSFRTLGLWFYARWWREFLLGVGTGAAATLLGTVALMSGGWVRYEGLAANAASALPGTLVFALFLLLPAATEEFLLRGYFFQRLLESWGKPAAIGVPAILFGLAHLNNPDVTPLSTANTMLAGVLLAAAYLKTRALWLPIGLHWGWNATMGPGLSLPVSGLRAAPPLFQVSIAGPEWLTGGNYGPEGSILVTVVCGAAILALWKAPWITPSPAMQDVLK